MQLSLEQIENHYGLVILAFLAFAILVALAEFVVELKKKQITRWRLGEMWGSFGVFLVAQLTEKAATIVYVVTFFYVSEWIPWEIPVNHWTTLGAILFVDFLYYWEHRWEHQVRVLWSYHSIHHSSPIYNYTTALRVSFIDGFVTWIFFLPAVLVGFHPVVVLLAIGVMLMYQFWIHNEIIGKMGWYEKIFLTPSQHRVHHGSDAIYLDKNYGAIFSFWDRMFGTHQEELHRPAYGLTKPINTVNPVKIHVHEYANIWRDLKRARSIGEVLQVLFGTPGWKPKSKT